MSAKSRKEVLVRSASGLVYVALVLTLIFLKAPFFQIGMAVFSILVAQEAFGLVKKGMNSSPNVWISPIFGILPILMLFGKGLPLIEAGSLLAVFIALLLLWRFEKTKASALWLGLGILVQLPFWIMARLGWHDPFPVKIMLILFFLTWINDTLAYLAGSFWGKTKIAPSISPSKSVEGFMAGLIGSTLLVYLLAKFWLDTNPIPWMAFAIIYVPLAVAGDFFESHLKRKAGVKDSGKIMPGHGGALDRFDSFIFAIPLTYIYILNLLV